MLGGRKAQDAALSHSSCLDGISVRATVHSYEGPFEVGYAVASLVPVSLDHGRRLLDRLRPHECRAPWRLPPDLPERLGVFVSIRLDGELRGCVGSVERTEPVLFLEIVRMAIGAGTGDPRFSPVEEAGIPFLDYSVDLIGPLEPTTRAQLDPTVYGIVVPKGDEMGVLLPAIVGVEGSDEQLRIACDKAAFLCLFFA